MADWMVDEMAVTLALKSVASLGDVWDTQTVGHLVVKRADS